MVDIKQIEDCFSPDGDNWQFQSVRNEDKDFIIEAFKKLKERVKELEDFDKLTNKFFIETEMTWFRSPVSFTEWFNQLLKTETKEI